MLEARLAELLGSLFTPEHLHIFLRHHVDSALVDELPGHGIVSPQVYASSAAEQLIRQGLATPGLFTALIEKRPGRAAEIGALAADFAI